MVRGGTHADCRPRTTAALLTATLITLFLTLHVTLYDTAVYEVQVASAPPLSFNQAVTYPTHVHFPRTSRRLPQVSVNVVRLPGVPNYPARAAPPVLGLYA